MTAPLQPKIYHIVHADRVASIVQSGGLSCDALITNSGGAPGTTIGAQEIKNMRLARGLTSRPGLLVGGCVPFYFCPRSIMLYMLYKGNSPKIIYRGGQGPIVHLECDLAATVAWAEHQGLRWAFTLSNAASAYFEDRADLAALDEIDWAAVQTSKWSPYFGAASGTADRKQAEFLVEKHFPWHLIERIGVHGAATAATVLHALPVGGHRPPVQVTPQWYYA
jgi:hypothetical protein